MFRISLAYSMSFWIQAAINQSVPCTCNNKGMFQIFERLNKFLLNLINKPTKGIIGVGWGMPSNEMMTGTVVSLHVFENITKIGSLLLLLLLSASQVLIGK